VRTSQDRERMGPARENRLRECPSISPRRIWKIWQLSSACNRIRGGQPRRVSPSAAFFRQSLLVLVHNRHRYKTGEGELLDPSVLGLQRRHFRRIEIAFRIDGQVVQRTKLSRSRAP